MSIVVERPRTGPRGKRANFYRAYTGNPSDGATQMICDGAPGESAADVRKRAVILLAEAIEREALHVRAVSPGMDGAAADVWILSGNPVVGYHYGRVYAYGCAPGLGSGEGRPTLQCGTLCSSRDEIEVLTGFLAHMADCYPAETWGQFLWSNIYAPWCERSSVDIAAIKAEIHDRDQKRAAMEK